jgi:hypothetical protein
MYRDQPAEALPGFSCLPSFNELANLDGESGIV